MLRRTKILLGILVAVAVGSFALERVAEALNPAVGANGISWTCLGTDTCPGGATVCTHANAGCDKVTNHKGDTWYDVAVSPSPSTTGVSPSWNNTDHKWYLSSAGSGTVTSVVIGNGLSSTQSPLTTTGTMSIDTSVVVDKTTAQSLSNKTYTAPIFSGSCTGTYSIAGTPTLAANLATNGFVGPNYGGTSTNVSAPTWIDVASGVGFQNSWVNDGTTHYPTAAYRKDSLGYVHLRGYIKTGTVGQTIFTLPAGYRPSTQYVFFPCYSGSACLGQVDTSGNVTLLAGLNTGSTITAIFAAEQ